MVIIEKNISKEQAEEIQDIMGMDYAYDVQIVEDNGKYIITGSEEAKECYEEEVK